MQPNHFPNAPNMGHAFNKAQQLQPVHDAEQWPTHDDLDHLELSELTLTPGGDLEYYVHRQVREKRIRQVELATPDKNTLADEKELDFEEKFNHVARSPEAEQNLSQTEELSPDALREQIEREVAEFDKSLEQAPPHDRGTDIER
jgi:hypothetical protein